MNKWFQHWKTWFKEAEQNRVQAFWILCACCLFTLPILLRASSLFFQADDYRFLWWAYENADTPWHAFYDSSLFQAYYRPVVSLIWWLNYLLFGIDPFYHQLALSCLWLGILVFLFFWGWRIQSPWAGALMVLFFLGNHGGHQWVFWKSWFTSMSSVFFQLAALWGLYSFLLKPTKAKSIIVAMFFLLAWFSKESAVFCLPITSIVLILSLQEIPLVRRIGSILTVLFVTLILFMFHDTAQGFLYKKTTFSQNELMLLSFYAKELWGHVWWLIFAFLLVTLHHIRYSGIYAWRLIISLSLSAIFFFIVSTYELPLFQVFALTFTVYTYTLLLTPWNRLIWLPLAWLTIAFWPLYKIGYEFIGYIGDSLLALSWIMGIALYQWLKNIEYDSRFLNKRFQKFSIAIFLILILLGLNSAYHRSFRWLDKVYNYTPMIVQRVIDDLRPIQYNGTIYIDVGERLTYETYLALTLIHRYPGFDVRTKPISNNIAYRLGAFTHRTYSVYPKKEPLPLWLDDKAGTPPQSSFSDPYWTTDHWNKQVLTACDDINGWNPKENIRLVHYPKGPTRNYLNSRFSITNTERIITYQTNKLLLAENENFVLHFWLISHRWDLIDSVTVRLEMNDKIYEWNKVRPSWVSTYHNWRRLSLSNEESTVQPRESNRDITKWGLTIHPRQGNLGYAFEFDLSVDEIILAMTKQ